MRRHCCTERLDRSLRVVLLYRGHALLIEIERVRRHSRKQRVRGANLRLQLNGNLDDLTRSRIDAYGFLRPFKLIPGVNHNGVVAGHQAIEMKDTVLIRNRCIPAAKCTRAFKPYSNSATAGRLSGRKINSALEHDVAFTARQSAVA